MPKGTRLSHPATIGPLKPDDASRLIEAAADVALVLDADGTVRDLTFRDSSLEGAMKDAASWRGRKLTDMLSGESRPKAAALLDAAVNDRDPHVRHLNHPATAGSEIAIEYAAIRSRQGGPIIAFGRDLRPIAALQQRLLDAQQAISRDYAALRQAQARYRLLFDTAPEPLIVLDAQSMRVTEINETGMQLPGAGKRLLGKPFTDLFEPGDRSNIQRFLSAIRAAGRADSIRVRLAGAEFDEAGEVVLSASLLTEEEASVLMVRLLPRTASVPDPSELSDRLLSALEQAPDAFVFTGPDGAVIAVNGAFLAMAQLPSADRARGVSLEEWLGQPGVDVPVLLANLRQRGTVRLFRTTIRGVNGLLTEVEISAVAVFGTELPSYGFSIRDVGRRLEDAAPTPETNAVMPRSVEQLTELIGRVSLKDLVRDATDVIERLCIEAALELTGDNRASAAEMLGLSRQSLYVKLRRYGLGDLDDAGDDA
jgi:transcriptional regulator PpsR